jgi:hypothetical protein
MTGFNKENPVSNPMCSIDVLNRENGEIRNMPIRLDRMGDFLKALKNPPAGSAERWGENDNGVSATAVAGMSTIIAHIPQRFPVIDILRYFQDVMDGAVTLEQVENTFAHFSRTYPMLRGDGSEV